MNQPNLQGEVQQKTGQTIFQIIAELQTLERKVDQIVVTSAPGEPGKKGDRGAPGKTAPSTSVFYYKADANSTAANDPGAGKLRWNNATQASATFLYLDWLTTDGFDVTALFKLMGAPQQFIIQDQDLALNYQVWRMTGPVVMMPDWFQVPVAFVSSGGSGVMANNQKIALLIASASGVPGSGAPGGVVGQLQVNGGGGLFAGGNLSGDVATANGTGTTLATVNTTPGTFGDATHVAQVTVDAKGRVTTVSSVAIGISGGQNQTPWLQDINAAGFRLLSAGNIGIGTASPSHSLEIVSGSAVAATIGSASGAVGIGQSGGVPFIQGYTGVGAASGATLSLQPSGGNVGINTTSPLSQFSILTPPTAPSTVAQANAITIGESTNNPGYRLSIGIFTDASTWKGSIQMTNASAGSHLILNGIGGNVGIGLIAPAYKLDVTGDCNISGTYRVNGVPISTGGGGSQTPWLQDIQGAGFKLFNTGYVGILADSVGGGGAAQLSVGGRTDPRKALWISFDTTANVGRVDAGISGVSWNPLLINPNGGSVSVGTTNTFGPFGVGGLVSTPSLSTITEIATVYGNSGVRLAIGITTTSHGAWLQSTISDGRAFGLYLNPLGGRVGVGTTNPLSLLELYTTAVNATIDVLTLNGVYGVVNVEQRIKFLGSGQYLLGYIGCGFDGGGSTGYLAFGTGGNGTQAERVRIDINGRVGIGTTVPSVPLSLGASLGEKVGLYDGGGQLYGFGIQSAQLQIYVPATTSRVSIGYGTSASFTETLTVTNNKVGIGAPSPGSGLLFGTTLAARLHVIGGGNATIAVQSSDNTAGVLYAEGGGGAILGLCQPSAPTGFRILDILSSGGIMNFRQINDAYSIATATGLTINYNNSSVSTGFSLSTGAITCSVITANSGAFMYGQILVWSGGVAADYSNAAIQVRETGGAAGASSGDNRYRPRIGFHWAGVVAAQIGMNNDGTLCAIDNPGTGYAPFQCSQLNASNLYAPTWNGYYAPGAAVGTAYSVAYFDGNAYLYTTWINTVSGDNGTAPITRFYASSDAFLRYYTIANFRYQLGIATQFTNPPKVLGTVYQNTTGKPITINVVVQFNAANSISVFSDAAAAPATTVSVVSCSSTGIYTLSFLVLQNHYYRVQSGANVVLVSWIEWL